MESIDDIFLNARELNDPDQRAAYLAKACAGDTALRARIEAMLRDAEGAENFFGPNDSLVAAACVTEAPGTIIGRYKLLQKIGEGGMGIVYMAEQREPVVRKVALKVIKLGMDTRQVIARFEAERQALALMDHPNIAKVLDGGTTQTGRPYFVMDLVQGLPITQFCDEAQLSTRDRLDLFLEVCSAFQHAHQKGIIHRDIKPSNILVTLHGDKPVPKVIDFGIAKATQQPLTDKTLFTQFQHFIGTPAYMSPEQASLSGLDIDTRSDIYGLGVLLYELLTGTTPFDGKELLKSGLDEMRRTIREKEPPRPSTKLRALSLGELTTAAQQRRVESLRLITALRGDLDWVVMKCLEKDRARRYETANGLAMDVRRHLNNEAVVARPPSPVYRFQKFARRNKILFTAGAATALALMLGITASTTLAILATKAERRREQEAQRAAKEAARARQAETLAAEQAKMAVEERERAERNLYAADMLLAQRAWEDSNLGLAVHLLDKHRPRPGRPDFRGWEWRYLWHQCQSDELFSFERHPMDVAGVAFSPDGLHAVTITSWDSGREGSVRIWDFISKQEVARPHYQDAVGSVASSVDGKLLAFGTYQRGVRLWSIELNREVTSFPGQQTLRFRGLAFAPTEPLLAIGDREGQISLRDIQTGELRRTIPAHSNGVSALAFLPDSRTLVSGSHDFTVKLWDTVTGQLRQQFTNYSSVQTLAVSPDGRFLVSGGWSGRRPMMVYDLSGNQPVVLLTNHTSWVSSVAFSPDGTILGSASADQTIRLWDVGTWEQREILRGHRDEVSGLAFSPDGKRLLSGAKNGDVKVWQLKGRRPNPPFLPWPRGTRDWTLSCDGTSLALLHADDSFSVWDPSRTRQIARHHLPIPVSNIVCHALGAAGRKWAYASKNGTLTICDTRTGEAIVRVEHPPEMEAISRIAFSATGRMLATATHDSRSVRLLDSENLKLLRVLSRSDDAPNQQLKFLQSDEALAAASGKGVVDVWDLNRAEQFTLRRHKDISDLALMPGGQHLATVGLDATARLWDLAARQETMVFGRTLNAFRSVAPMPHGQRIVTGLFDGVIALWDMQTSHEIIRLRGTKIGNGEVMALCFPDDGNTIVAMSSDGINVWRAPAWDEIAAVEQTRTARQ